MDAETLILAVLDAIPNKQIQGRKRLQKMSYFALQKGAEANVRFFLHDFGPFSPDVASATDLLSFLGDINEQEVQLGRTRLYSKLYRLTDCLKKPRRRSGLSMSFQPSNSKLRRQYSFLCQRRE
jgi:uncharacterized protein YwgA